MSHLKEKTEEIAIERLTPYRFLLLAAVLAIIVTLFLTSSEEEKVLEQLEQIRALTELRTTENSIQQAAKGRQIAQYFHAQTTFDLSNAGFRKYEIPTQQELVQQLIKGRHGLTALELALHDPKITVDGDSARVEVQGSALGSMRDRQERFFERHRIEIVLRKEDGEWLVLAARHIRDERSDAGLLQEKPDAPPGTL